MTNWLTNDATGRTHLILAHGAGAPMDSAFMTAVAEAIARSGDGVSVHRFEFAYMAGRRTGGPKRPPPRVDRLRDEYVDAIDALSSRLSRDAGIFIGGKSMGGRVASLVADDLFVAGRIKGLVCLGYPFHPQGKPETLRTEHLERLTCPALIVQGERDPFGSSEEVPTYRLSPLIRLHWLHDGDHDFGPRGRSGITRAANIAEAASAVVSFCRLSARSHVDAQR